MSEKNNKTIYIAFGIVLLLVAIPVMLAFLGFLGGVFFYMRGAN